ncbi:MAG: hypothetical protein ACJAT1_001153 [Marivirga sp.]|jgi:hypothetical protein
MKLSNKILIGFFGCTFLYMTAAFTELRFKGDIHRFVDSNSISETTSIAGVNYLVLSDLDQRITVSGSDDPRIEVTSATGDLMQYLKYAVSGDTLFIKKSAPSEKLRFNVSIHVSKANFIGMTSTNTGVTIHDLEQETLNIIQSDGWIRMTGNNRFGKITLKAQNKADFRLLNGNVDTLHAIINKSDVSISQPLKLVKGTMTNESYLRIGAAGEIQFKTDESSRLVLN